MTHTGTVEEVGPSRYALLAEQLQLTTTEASWFGKKEESLYEATGDAPKARTPATGLPLDDESRKALPLWTFLFEYFPDAFVEVCRVSVVGNQKHNPGTTTPRWAREKSTDQLNTAMRHLFDYGRGTKMDTDGVHHLAKAIWRLSAQLQLELEKARP